MSRRFDDDEDDSDFRQGHRRRNKGRSSRLVREEEAAYVAPLAIPAPRSPVVVSAVPLEEGTVKFFNGEKGFGFISPSAGGGDVFVHVTVVRRAGLLTLTEGQVLRFEREASKKQVGRFSASRIEV